MTPILPELYALWLRLLADDFELAELRADHLTRDQLTADWHNQELGWTELRITGGRTRRLTFAGIPIDLRPASDGFLQWEARDRRWDKIRMGAFWLHRQPRLEPGTGRGTDLTRRLEAMGGA